MECKISVSRINPPPAKVVDGGTSFRINQTQIGAITDSRSKNRLTSAAGRYRVPIVINDMARGIWIRPEITNQP